MKRLLLALAFFSSCGLAQPVFAAPVGFSPYAITSPHWHGAEMMAAFRNLAELRIAMLYNTFGHSYTWYDALISDPRTRVVQVHLINAPCQRNHRCGRYEFLHGLSAEDYERKLLKRDRVLLARLRAYFAKAYKQLIEPLPRGVRCLLSPELESNLSTKAGKVLLSEAHRVFGRRCRLVWNPLHGQPIAGAIFEQHGEAPAVLNSDEGCLYNPDGVVLSEAEAVAAHRNYPFCIRFDWTPADNCNAGGGAFEDPRARTRCARTSDFERTKRVIRRAK